MAITDAELASMPMQEAAPAIEIDDVDHVAAEKRPKLRDFAKAFRESRSREDLTVLKKERKIVVGKLTVVKHHASRCADERVFTPKRLQTDITYEPMLKYETDIVETCKAIENRFKTNVQKAMAKHYTILAKRLESKLHEKDDKLADYLEWSEEKEKQRIETYTDILTEERDVEETGGGLLQETRK